MKRVLAFCFLWTACLPVEGQAPVLHQRDTLLYVHFLQDGSLGEIQIFSAPAEKTRLRFARPANCSAVRRESVTRRMWIIGKKWRS